MNAQHSRHARTKTMLAVELNIVLRAISSDLEAWCEPSTRVSDHSLPEPDIVLTSHRGEGVVPLESVALIVEVSDTTLGIEIGRKLGIYAGAGVPEYWVADVEGHVIHEMWGPVGNAYAERRAHAFGADVAMATLAGVSVATGRLG
jgi:Uma2 family endonuclease